MTFTNRNFGVEIEYTGIARNTLRYLLNDNGYSCDLVQRANNLQQWSVVYDGSVSGSGGAENTNNGGEVVSPILSGEDGIEKIGKVARLMLRNGARADRSCGLHVHVDATDITVPELKTIVRRYSRFEREIDGFMPRSRRNNDNNFCYSINQNYLSSIDWCQTRNDFSGVGRYYKVNLNAYYKHGTIEFRQHSGSINPEKIRNWVRFCVSFVEESRNIHRAMEAEFNRAQSERIAAEAARNLAEAARQISLSLSTDGNGNPVISANVAPATRPSPHNQNRPANYPIGPVSDDNNTEIQILNRESLNARQHFRRLTYAEVGRMSHSPVEYTLQRLISGFDIVNDSVYTYARSTVRNAMSALRNAGFRINHRRGTNNYILAPIQPRSVFSGIAQDTVFTQNYVDPYEADRLRMEARRRERERQAAIPICQYNPNMNDTLFAGINEEVVAFYQERATEFETQLANGR